MKNLFFTLLLLSVLTYSQQRNLDTKFRLAQSFESIGDWENAVKIYEEIYAADSTSQIFFEALLRSYDQLKRYNDAEKIINQRLQKQPNDINLLSKLGKIYARSGEIKKAESVWQNIIDSNPNNLNVYSIVANEMIESRFFESALKTYEQGRTISKNENVFANEIAYLHSILMNYTEATREYLNIIKRNPEQLNFVQSRMSIYTQKSDGLKAAIYVTETALQKDPKNVPLNRLIAWLYMEGKNYESAFKIYKILDELSKSDGKEIHSFAERAKRERAYTQASKAFQELLKNFPKFQNISAVKFGFAETLEAALEESDSLRIFGEIPILIQYNINADSISKKYIEIINLYNQIAEQYPNTEYAARSIYRIALIYFEKFFNVEKSLASINEIENKYRFNSIIYSEALLLKAKLLLINDNIDEAEAKLKYVINYPGSTIEHKEIAKYMLAQISYFKGNFQDALTNLQEILKNQTSDLVNDAISLQVLINDNSDDEKNLKLFSKAQLFKMQHKYEDAIKILSEIAAVKTELSGQAISELGDVYTFKGDYTKALDEYEKLIKNFPDDLLVDKTIFKIAEIYLFALKDKSKAEEYYKKLLEAYPSSIYINEARKKIREIRGEVL